MLHKLSFTLLFTALTCGQIASAQNTNLVKCPDSKPLEEFQWPAFEGVWYEYSRYQNNLEVGVECVNLKFAINNNKIAITFSGAYASNQTSTFDVAGNILGPGVFTVTINKNGGERTDKILGIDYNSWAAVYTCDDIGSGQAGTAWIITRERYPNGETVGQAMTVLNKNGISTKYLRNTRQDGCPAHI